MVASVRIAKWLQKKLDMPLVWNDEIGKMNDLDVLVIVNGAYGFSSVLDLLGEAIYRAKTVVWVQNDYTIIPPINNGDAETPFRKAFVRRKEDGKSDTIYWSTCEKWFSKPNSHQVNWNQLTFDEDYDEKIVIPNRRKLATNTLLYYGSFRKDRVELFDRYFAAPFVKTIVSCPNDKFKEAYPNIVSTGPIKEDFFNVIGSYGLGLYVEDRKSSREYHSPANRFYEMLSAGLPMVFQPECGPMLRKAGFDPEPYFVHKASDIKKIMADREDVGMLQRAQWIKKGNAKFFRDNLESQLAVAKKDVGL
jgi:hypothetical protein